MAGTPNPDIHEVVCGACQTPLNIKGTDAAREPCGSCGATSRCIRMRPFTAVDNAAPSLALKAKPPSGRWFVHVIQGRRELFRKLGRWHVIDRRIDRKANRYTEKITDLETGAIVKQQDHPLSEHTGHGADRTNRRQHD